MTAPHPELDQLIATLERLRAPGGCVWDREQTHASLVQYLVEETFELVEAIEVGSREELIEELGDVLYQVIFHADIAAEAGEFTLEDVAAHMRAKMVARHPHVFGDVTVETSDDVVATWEAVKSVEKAHRTSVLEGVPQGMPSLALADKLLGRAAKVGVERGPAVIPASEQQLGAELLAIVAGARATGLDAERALREALRTLQDEVRAAEGAPRAGSAEGVRRGSDGAPD
ncbi:MazG family protein [Lysinimonas soli]|uniref:MazG family protein n=1 Tax=Lysinimonas soli TaxID=1074233 RepID=A0ABW0NP04_9MICO